MRKPGIVGMNDQQFGIFRVAQLFCKVLLAKGLCAKKQGCC